MNERKDSSSSQEHGPAIDPAIWRGLTQPRMSRRQLLASAGAGAGAIGLSGLLAACGFSPDAGAPDSGP